MTLEEVLRTYNSVKGHRSRCERESNSLIEMLKVQYSAPSEVRVKDRLEKLEKYTHKLSGIMDYLLTAKYTKAQDHAKEVAEFFATLDAIFRVIHERHAAAREAAIAALPAPAPARASAKPSAKLKPKELSHDASMATFRTWKKQYYDVGNIGSLPCTQQQAYLNNCINEALRSRIDRESTVMTPIYSPIQGLMTCVRVLDNYFLEVNPCLLYTSPSPRDRQKSRMPSSA